jgi:cephalosporin hydroxylase
MKQEPEFSMTVGELAFSMRLDIDTVKEAANASSAYTQLRGAQLNSTLDRLKSKLSFQPRGWDLSLLNDFRGGWVDSLRKLYSTPVAFPASLPPSQGIQIRELILREAPERVLEIGCFIGISSHWIASALNENGKGCLDSVDTFWPKYPLRFHFSYLADPFLLATNAASQSEVGKRITFHRSDSATFAKKLSLESKYDFIFIDGDHTFEGVTRDFLMYFPYLRRRGVILLHDTNPAHCGWDGPRRLIDEVLKNNPDVLVDEIETTPNYGLATVRKLTEKNLTLSTRRAIGIFTRLAIFKATNMLKDTLLTKYVIRKIVKPLVTHVRSR